VGYRWIHHGLIPCRSKIFFFSPLHSDQLWDSPASCLLGTAVLA